MSLSVAYSVVLGLNYNYELLGPIWDNSGASDNDSIAYIFPQIFEAVLDTLEIPGYAKDYYLARFLKSNFESNQSNPVLEDVYTSWRNDFPDSPFKMNHSRAECPVSIWQGISFCPPQLCILPPLPGYACFYMV